MKEDYDITKEGRLLLKFFRKSQKLIGNIGCNCWQCQEDMSIAYEQFKKKLSVKQVKVKDNE